MAPEQFPHEAAFRKAWNRAGIHEVTDGTMTKSEVRGTGVLLDDGHEAKLREDARDFLHPLPSSQMLDHGQSLRAATPDPPLEELPQDPLMPCLHEMRR